MPSQRQAGDGGHGQMNAVAQRVARHQQPREPMRQRIDDGNFEREPAVVDQQRKYVALGEKPPRAFGKTVQCRQQRRRRLRLAERLHANACAASKSSGI